MTPKEFFKPLAEAWKQRCEGQSIKRGSIKERRLQCEFMLGATYAFTVLVEDKQMIESLNGYVTLMIGCGRDIVTEMERIDDK